MQKETDFLSNVLLSLNTFSEVREALQDRIQSISNDKTSSASDTATTMNSTSREDKDSDIDMEDALSDDNYIPPKPKTPLSKKRKTISTPDSINYSMNKGGDPRGKKKLKQSNTTPGTGTGSSKKPQIVYLVKEKYNIGDYVISQCPSSGSKQWYTGLINCSNRDGTYRINYNDGSRSDDITPEQIRCLTSNEVKRIKKADKDKRAKTSYVIKKGRFRNAGIRVRVAHGNQLGLISVNDLSTIDSSDLFVTSFDVNLDDGTRLDDVEVKFLTPQELKNGSVSMLPAIKTSDLIAYPDIIQI